MNPFVPNELININNYCPHFIELAGWRLSGVAIDWMNAFLGGNLLCGNFPGGVFLGGICPGGTYPGWEFSLVEVFRVGIVRWESSGWQFSGWEFSYYQLHSIARSFNTKFVLLQRIHNSFINNRFISN